MKNKSKKRKVLAILGGVLAGIVLIPSAFLGILTAISFSRSLPTHATEKIENPTGLVQQKGKALFDKNGDYLLLRGVNVGNLLVSESWLSPFGAGESLDQNGDPILDHDSLPTYPELPMEEAIQAFRSNPNLDQGQQEELIRLYRDSWFGEEDFALVREMGLNLIRLPFYWRDILEEDYRRKKEEEAFAYLDSFLENCKKNGLYCILDLHGAPGSQNAYEHSGDLSKADLWKEERHQEAVADLWAYIASYYKEKRPDLAPSIASFDLLNEPCTSYENPGDGTDPDIAYPVYDRIYKAIRATGDQHVITIEGMWSYDSFRDPKDYGWTNILHETHMYNWDHEKVPYWLFNDYHELRNWGHDYDVPMFIGEFTFFEDAEAWKKQLSFYQKRGYSWAMWTYKAAVTGWWTTSWSILTQKLDLRGGKRKANLKEGTYEELKEAAEKCASRFCQKSNTYNYILDFLAE